jgi:hypothetical protein
LFASPVAQANCLGMTTRPAERRIGALLDFLNAAKLLMDFLAARELLIGFVVARKLLIAMTFARETLGRETFAAKMTFAARGEEKRVARGAGFGQTIRGERKVGMGWLLIASEPSC